MLFVLQALHIVEWGGNMVINGERVNILNAVVNGKFNSLKQIG
jgi:hypothetical protein